MIRGMIRTGVCGLLLLGLFGPAAAAEQVHGEDSSFRGHGVTMVWGILKAIEEEGSEVVIRLAADPMFTFLRWDGVDPFTGGRRVMAAGQPLRTAVELRSLRGSFAEFTRREFHFFRTAEELEADRPALTVYFLGIPDTAPEFLAESALQEYLNQTLAKLAGGGARPIP